MTQVIVRRLPSINNELYHHGVEGQKWGVRRYQNKDGSLTAAGYKHYGFSTSGKRGIRRLQKKIAERDAASYYYFKKSEKANIERNARLKKGKDTSDIDKKIGEYNAMSKQASKESKILNERQKENLKRASKYYDIKTKDVLKTVNVEKGKDILKGLGAVTFASAMASVYGFGIASTRPSTTAVASKKYIFKKKIIDNTHVEKEPVKKQPVKQQTASKSKGLSWDDSYKVTKVSDVPKSAKLQFDKHDGVTEVSWLTNDGHIAYGEYDPKTKKIFDVNING